MPRRTRPILTALLATLLLAACGGDNEPAERRPAAQATPNPASTPEAPALVPTDGRLGGAITADAGDGQNVLERGGRFPDAIFDDPSDESGVAGGRSCPDRDLVPTATNLRRVARVTFCLMNAERRRRGVPALTQNRLLALASLRHSRDMVRRRYFEHDSPSGRKLADRLRAVRYIPRGGRWTVGENLAWGSGAVAAPRAIVRAWMASPGHRANLLSPKYSAVGLGIVFGTPKGPGGGGMFTTDFGRVG